MVAPAERTPYIPVVAGGMFYAHPDGSRRNVSRTSRRRTLPLFKRFCGGCGGRLQGSAPHKRGGGGGGGPRPPPPTKAPPYKSGMPARSQVRMVSLSQREHCTSPMWAQPRISIHRRDCPIPPPMVRGSSPASSIL